MKQPMPSPDMPPASVHEMTVQELHAELNAVWRSDWQKPSAMTEDELRAEVLHARERGLC